MFNQERAALQALAEQLQAMPPKPAASSAETRAQARRRRSELRGHVAAIQRAVESKLPEDEPDCVSLWVYETAVEVLSERLRAEAETRARHPQADAALVAPLTQLTHLVELYLGADGWHPGDAWLQAAGEAVVAARAALAAAPSPGTGEPQPRPSVAVLMACDRRDCDWPKCACSQEPS